MSSPLIHCPNCDSEKTVTNPSHRRLMGPRLLFNTIIRNHLCQACGKTYMTVQQVLTRELGEDLLEQIEKQSPGSEPMPNVKQ